MPTMVPTPGTSTGSAPISASSISRAADCAVSSGEMVTTGVAIKSLTRMAAYSARARNAAGPGLRRGDDLVHRVRDERNVHPVRNRHLRCPDVAARRGRIGARSSAWLCGGSFLFPAHGDLLENMLLQV